jgi:hypothetical protein
MDACIVVKIAMEGKRIVGIRQRDSLALTPEGEGIYLAAGII